MTTEAARSLGPISLPRAGAKFSGFFTFGGDHLLEKYQWPYFAVVGREAGLTFLLTAGIHAAEYTGTLAALRLGQALDPEHVKGTIVIMPLLNRPGFFERSVYVNPEDGQNLNRAFPGDPNGTWSERFAYHLLNDVVLHADRAMDLHAGDMVEDLEPFLGYLQTGNASVDAPTLCLKGPAEGERREKGCRQTLATKPSIAPAPSSTSRTG